VNSYIRFKWTLTEERPTIKAYDEAGDVGAPLALVGRLARPVGTASTLDDGGQRPLLPYPPAVGGSAILDNLSILTNGCLEKLTV
jgi:hypothetical protein